MAHNNDEPAVELHLPIESFDHYLERKCLRYDHDDQPTLNQIEEDLKAQEAEEYQEALLDKIFETEGKECDAKLRFLESLKDEHIRIDTAAGSIKTKLQPLATKCDTVYALASVKPLFQQECANWELSLIEFGTKAVREFVMMIEETMSPNNVSSETIIDCCQIAHYLQCPFILTAMIDILVVSVDSANCISLLQLADRLSLPRLCESCLTHLMGSMTNVEEMVEGELISSELLEQILAIKSAIQSSVVGIPRVYFGSIKEYLAIFAELVEYYKERLEEAQRSRVTPYIQRMIDKQEKRVTTLEAVMREQKKLFALQDGSIRIKKLNHNAF